MQYIFIRHGKLDLPFASHAEMPFDMVCSLANQELDPGVDRVFMQDNMKRLEEVINFNKIVHIYSGPSQRAITTAKFLAEQCKEITGHIPNVTTQDDAKEICFHIKELMPEGKDGTSISVINDLVPRSLFKDIYKHCENIASVLKRIRRLFQKLSEHTGEGVVLIVTNGFLMRAIDAYICNQGEISEKGMIEAPENSYLHGFIVDGSFSHIMRL